MTDKEIYDLVETALAEQKAQLQEEFQRQLGEALKNFTPSKLPLHKHNNLDGSQQLDPSEALFGFQVTTVAPTDAAPEGTIRLYVDSLSSPTAWRLYIRAAKTWKYKTIDNAA